MQAEKLFVTQQAFLNDAQIKQITALGDELIINKPDVFKSKVDGRRNCNLSWFGTNFPEMDWLFNALMHEAIEINNTAWKRKLTGIVEPLQYAHYEQGDYFNWHMDARGGTIAPRQLTMILQLSYSDEYVGGNVEVRCGNSEPKISRTRGSLTVFPSDTIHCARYLENGQRKSLVAWVGGDTADAS